MVHMYPLLHVVTYMTRIDYKALLTLFAKAYVVQWIERRTPDSGADGSNHGVRFYLEKFTEYLQTFIYILARLSLWVILSSQVNACISEFDLLLSTYSKWLYNDQFRPYLVYM